MAKSIRSKAKRKLRAVKREKLAAKERIRLIAIRDEEEGVKMAQDATESNELGQDISPISGDGNEASMEIESVLKAKKKKIKKSKSGSGKNVKRLNKKKNKYKW